MSTKNSPKPKMRKMDIAFAVVVYMVWMFIVWYGYMVLTNGLLY